jgi:hypothetical protein
MQSNVLYQSVVTLWAVSQEDVMLSNCLKSAGVRLYDSRDSMGRHRFHHATPRGRYLPFVPSSAAETYSIGLDSRWLRKNNCCARYRMLSVLIINDRRDQLCLIVHRDSITFHFIKDPVAMRAVHYVPYHR